MQASAEEVVGRLPASCVERYHIYFPDPWPKARHRRRRLLRAENLERICRSLRTGGEMLFATDFFDYFLQTKLLCLLNQQLELFPTRPPEEIFLSIYGKIFIDQGRTVYCLTAKKVARPDSAQEQAQQQQDQ